MLVGVRAFPGPSPAEAYHVPFAFQFCTNLPLVQWALVRRMARFTRRRHVVMEMGEILHPAIINPAPQPHVQEDLLTLLAALHKRPYGPV